MTKAKKKPVVVNKHVVKPLEKKRPDTAANLRWADDGGDVVPRSHDPGANDAPNDERVTRPITPIR